MDLANPIPKSRGWKRYWVDFIMTVLLRFFLRSRQRGRWTFFSGRLHLFPVLAATGAAGAIAMVTILLYMAKPMSVPGAGWDVSRVAGTPRIGGNKVSGKETSRLGIGQMLETDQQSRASLRADNTGQIEVEQNTRLHLSDMRVGLKRITLDRGTIHAYIWAPPGDFVVDTPSAVTVDLGCVYTLRVDEAGAGLVRTSLGWVGLSSTATSPSSPLGRLARQDQRSVRARRTLKMRLRSSAPLWRDSILRTAHRRSAPRISRSS